MSVSVGPEAKSGLAGWFWLKVSHEAAVKVQRVPQPLKAGLGPKGWLLRGLTPMDGKFMVPVGRKPQFFTLWTFSTGLLVRPRDMAAGSLQKGSQREEGGNHNVCCDLVTFCHFHTPLRGSALCSVEGDRLRAGVPGGGVHLEAWVP